jgi:hypothetical protein
VLLGTQTQFSNGDDLSPAEAVPIDFTAPSGCSTSCHRHPRCSRWPHRDGNIIPGGRQVAKVGALPSHQPDIWKTNLS